MKNTNSTSGIAEDLIRSFIQVGCGELHLKTILEKRVSEIENGMIEEKDIQDTIQRIDELKQEISDLAEIRRSQMLYLFNLFDNGDKEMWCMVKHIGLASFTSWETYQASDDDSELLSQALELNKQFIKFTSRFLGQEIDGCSSCFADMLKGIERGDLDESKNAKDLSTKG